MGGTKIEARLSWIYFALWLTLELLNVIHNYKTKLNQNWQGDCSLKIESNSEQMNLIVSQVGGLYLPKGITVSPCFAQFQYPQI